MSTTETVQVASVIPKDLADSIRALAARRDRSIAAEIRLALRAWDELAKAEEAAA